MGDGRHGRSLNLGRSRIRIGGRITPTEIRADAVDGNYLDVPGEGKLTFELWGHEFT